VVAALAAKAEKFIAAGFDDAGSAFASDCSFVIARRRGGGGGGAARLAFAAKVAPRWRRVVVIPTGYIGAVGTIGGSVGEIIDAEEDTMEAFTRRPSVEADIGKNARLASWLSAK
jgi:hypothetical protein